MWKTIPRSLTSLDKVLFSKKAEAKKRTDKKNQTPKSRIPTEAWGILLFAALWRYAGPIVIAWTISWPNFLLMAASKVAFCVKTS